MRSRSRLLAATAAAATLFGVTLAAGALTAHRAGDRAELTADVNAPLFGARNALNLLPGQARTACLGIGNRGDAPGRAALYAPGLTGDLAPYLTLTVTRGTRAQEHSSSCGSFVADAATFGTTRPGVVYRGRLSDFPTRLQDALVDPDQWAPGDRHAYRFELALGEDPQAAGRSVRWDWRLAVDSLATARPSQGSAAAASSSATPHAAEPVSCTSITVSGTGLGSTRRLIKTVRIDRRVRAVLMLRTTSTTGALQVKATTGLRVAGKTLRIPGWARVRYRLNGTMAASTKRRPFRVSLAARTFRPGTNRVSVAVQPRRRALRSLTSFKLTATPITIGGRTTCVVSA